MSKKILVVDDDPDIVFMIQSTLEKNGFEVSTASNGQDALKILKTLKVDLMIVDLTMPGLSGWHFTMKARQMDQYAKTPIIVLSGLIDGPERAPEKFEQGTIYMAKPFDIFKLIDRVKELLP